MRSDTIVVRPAGPAGPSESELAAERSELERMRAELAGVRRLLEAAESEVRSLDPQHGRNTEALYRLYIGSISALYRHRGRPVHCAGMGVPVLKMVGSARRSF